MVVGYGLTESTATVSCFLNEGYEIGSVGTVTATIYEAVCRTMMARIMFCTVSLKIVTTQNGLPQKSTTMKLTRMVFAKLHVPSTPMWPQCMAGKLYRTTSFR